MSTADQRTKRKVTLIPGDGIGPEVIAATCRVIEAVGAPIEWEPAEAGASVFRKGIATGVPDDTIASIRRNRLVLKGPLETPVGYGEKSANVTLRVLFELYANIRPARELPGVPTLFSARGVDLVVVRENVEDLYAGVEHMQTPGVAQCLKLMSRKGCEKIVRLAFELAVAEGRKCVHCATKANIMKMTEGLLKRTFEDVAREYPQIRAEHIIIDNCAHQLVRFPEQFEVIVTSNMNGDILSDLTSGLVGGLGFAPSANIGNEVVMFEAVHGSAPNIAGKNVANPTALILSAAMMLRHMGEFAAGATIENAVLFTLERGEARTADVGGERVASTTTEFTDAVIRNLGRRPSRFAAREHHPLKLPSVARDPVLVRPKSRKVVGADVFIESGLDPVSLGKSLERLVEGTGMALASCANRGVKVYPLPSDLVDCVDHYRCRFVMKEALAASPGRAAGASLADGPEMLDANLAAVLHRIGAEHRWMHVEKLQVIDGAEAFSKAQGEG